MLAAMLALQILSGSQQLDCFLTFYWSVLLVAAVFMSSFLNDIIVLVKASFYLELIKEQGGTGVLAAAATYPS